MFHLKLERISNQRYFVANRKHTSLLQSAPIHSLKCYSIKLNIHKIMQRFYSKVPNLKKYRIEREPKQGPILFLFVQHCRKVNE